MAQLSTKIKIYANQQIDFTKDVRLQNDGNGSYIKEWNINIKKPTIEQLNSFEEQANQYEQNLINEIENNKQSAFNKLKTLGLNDDEIKAIIEN